MMFLDKINMSSTYTCGSDLGFEFSGSFPYIVSLIITIIKIAVPVVLIIFGLMDFLKAVVKRLIAAIIVFFVIQIVQLVIGFASNSDADIVECFDCFVNRNSSNCVLVNAESD